MDRGLRVRRYLLISTLSNYAGQFVTFAVWLLLTPFIVHRLGVADFGLWAIAGSLLLFGRLFDFGISHAVAKYVAECRGRGDFERASVMVATALRMCWPGRCWPAVGWWPCARSASR
jgi:O-antigen/teichoic acid export membrane protein